MGIKTVAIDAEKFSDLADEMLQCGTWLRFRVRGFSMLPTIHDGDVLTVMPVGRRLPRVGEIVFYRVAGGIGVIAHRIVGHAKSGGCNAFITCGDAFVSQWDHIDISDIIGRVVSVENKSGRSTDLTGIRFHLLSRCLVARNRIRHFVRGLFSASQIFR